jgi:hypothetical protein
MLNLAFPFLFGNALFADKHFSDCVFRILERIVHTGACASHD